MQTDAIIGCYIFVKIVFLSCTRISATINSSIKWQTKVAQLNAKYITSPRWPLEYPTNYDVYYKIAQRPRKDSKSRFYIELKWLEFDIKGDVEDCKDYVSIRYRNERRKNFVFCSKRLPHEIYTAVDEIELHFHSDKENVGYGFKITYRLVSFQQKIGPKECSENIVLTAPTGIMSSMIWPNSEVRSSCVYEITLKEDEILLLDIMDFNTGQTGVQCNVYSNYVEIRGNASNKTFHESCPIEALSSCKNISTWTMVFEKKTLFVHVNTLEASRDSRGFLAGYTIYKKASEKKISEVVPMKNAKPFFTAVMIGAITGIVIGIVIVISTAISVKICLKRGIV